MMMLRIRGTAMIPSAVLPEKQPFNQPIGAPDDKDNMAQKIHVLPKPDDTMAQKNQMTRMMMMMMMRRRRRSRRRMMLRIRRTAMIPSAVLPEKQPFNHPIGDPDDKDKMSQKKESNKPLCN